MATFQKAYLSGSTTGKAIKITQTSTLGTAIHTARATGFDELWLWVTNVDTVAENLTLEWGGATDPDCLIMKAFPIPPQVGPRLIVDGLIIGNSLAVTAFCNTASKLLITGFVIQIQ